MLSMKKIDKIRYLYFKVGMPVTDIMRKTGAARSTIYKYLKEKNFSPQPKKPFVPKPKITDPYIPIVREWLIEDKRKHHKQRHTAKRVFDRLRELYPDMTASYPTIAILYRKLRSDVYYTHKEYAPLRHLPGEAQVDVGECYFYENGIKINGYFVVLSFSYSNAGFCQLFKSDNTQCVIQGIKNI